MKKASWHFSSLADARQSGTSPQMWRQKTACRTVMLGLCIAVGVLYVVQMSGVSTKGYDIAQLQKEIQALENENQRLAVEIAKHSSITRVRERMGEMKLVAADTYVFVSTGKTVARR